VVSWYSVSPGKYAITVSFQILTYSIFMTVPISVEIVLLNIRDRSVFQT